MYDPLAILALVVSVASVAFIVVREGIGLALGYRESEATQRRKREIDSKLRAEAKTELKKFISSVTLKERNEEKELESLVELGQSAFFARSISGRLLADMTNYMSSALGFLAVTLLVFFLTLYVGVSASDLLASGTIVPFAGFAGITMLSLYFTSIQLRRHYLLREKFVQLGEDITIEHCRKLSEELKKQNLW